jgi:hypothetical protein
MSKKAAEHHRQSAEHHTHAARHHGEAAKHHESGAHEKAAHHAYNPAKTNGSVRGASFSTGRAAVAYHLMSASRRKRPDCWAHAKWLEGLDADFEPAVVAFP